MIGREHPRFYPCETCGAKSMEHCKSRFGRIIKGYERMHAARFRKANQWIHGL